MFLGPLGTVEKAPYHILQILNNRSIHVEQPTQFMSNVHSTFSCFWSLPTSEGKYQAF